MIELLLKSGDQNASRWKTNEIIHRHNGNNDKKKYELRKKKDKI